MHARALEEANEKARRSKNILALCRGRFALDESDDDDVEEGNVDDDKQQQQQQKQQSFPPPQPHCRQYLSLLTQMGSLQLERKNYSAARKSLLEAIDLEGHHWPDSITNARYQLMNMYLSTNRPASARKLWNLLENDDSAWVRYSAALIEYVSWNILNEKGSSANSAERLLTRAIRGNVYVAYLLGWPGMFERAMEYTNEVVERGMDSRNGTILEAIEYGCCCYSSEEGGEEEEEERGMAMWLGTEGSLDWVRGVVLRVLNEDEIAANDGEGRLTKADLLSWENKLSKEEEEFERGRTEKEQRLQSSRDEIGNDGDSNNEEEEEEKEEEEPDVVMYAGMFRTAMDWLQDAGEFLKAPTFDYVNEIADDNDFIAGEEDSKEEKGEDDDTTDSSTDGSGDDTVQ